MAKIVALEQTVGTSSFAPENYTQVDMNAEPQFLNRFDNITTPVELVEYMHAEPTEELRFFSIK